MNRFTLGAITGGLAVFFLDPDLGDRRRRRLLGVWSESQEALENARDASLRALNSAGPRGRRLRRRIAGEPAWGPAVGTGFGIGAVLLAGAAGMAVSYLLDPDAGPQRRSRMMGLLKEQQRVTLDAGRRMVEKVEKTVDVAQPQAEELRRRAAGIGEETSARAR